MKKLYSIFLMALLVISVMPMVLAEGDEAEGDVDVGVENLNPPVIFTDPTDRIWNPNDQTFKTASKGDFGTSSTNAFCDAYWDVPLRGNYLFTGETVSYYVAVYDEDGEDNIDEVTLQKEDGLTAVGVGSCSQISETTGGCGAFVSDTFVNDKFAITGNADDVPEYQSGVNDDLFAFYRCTLVVQSSWSDDNEVSVKATDEDGHMAYSAWSDFLTLNPPLNIDLTGAVSFGTVEAGTTVTSNSVSLDNVGSDGVVMDMYIAADDYFTDPSDPAAICGLANGIPHCAFSYYATKGSIDSGMNDNSHPVLGVGTATSAFPHILPGCEDIAASLPYMCEAEADEFTRLPSHSGDVEDMCRIINDGADTSVLTQGQSMTLTFQLDVPTPCEGSFTDGKFHFVGRVV
jgi:hypothetical protein